MTSHENQKDHITEQLEAETPQEISVLLDRLKKRLDISTDTGLADLLGVKKSFVADVRAGRRKLPIWAKLQVLDKLGYLAARDAILLMTPKAFAHRISNADNARLQLDLSRLDDAHTDEDQSEEFREFENAVAAAIQKFGPTVVAAVVKTKIMGASTKDSDSKK